MDLIPSFTMPHQPTAIEIQLKNLAECLTLALEVLNELNSAFAPPFVQPISNTVASLVKLIQVLSLSPQHL